MSWPLNNCGVARHVQKQRVVLKCDADIAFVRQRKCNVTLAAPHGANSAEQSRQGCRAASFCRNGRPEQRHELAPLVLGKIQVSTFLAAIPKVLDRA